MRLIDITIQDTKNATSALILKFQPDRNVDFETLELNSLQLYLHGPAAIKYNMLIYLTKYVSSVSIRELGGRDTEYYSLKDYRIGIPELSLELQLNQQEFALLPYSQQTFQGYRLLHEYFSFPEKFFFINIEGISQFNATKDSNAFELRIEFDRKLSQEKWPGNNDILLHCTPIINLVNRPVEEVIVSQRLPEYYIIPDIDRRKSREIYSIDRVSGISENKIEQFKYIPITSQDILDTSDPEYDYKRFYSIGRRSIKGDMSECYIRLFGPSMEQKIISKETLSLEATLSNGFLPSAYLEAGVINQPLNFPAGIEASNLTVPSEVLECYDEQNYLWSLISHLSMSYNTLANTDNLKKILRLYNWTKAHNHPNRKKIDGIKKVAPPTIKSLVRNQGLIRGIEFNIDIDPEEFENGEGDIHLLGMVLNRFLSQYTTLNSFVFLTISEIGSERRYTWEPQLGLLLPV